MRCIHVVVCVLAACGDDTTTKSDASTSIDDSSADDAAVTQDDAASADAPTGGPGIACGTATCAAGMECCVAFGGGGGGATYTCIANGTTCEGISQACDGPEDCTSGDRCCGT